MTSPAIARHRLAIFFFCSLYPSSQPLDERLFLLPKWKSKVAERLQDASILATENRNCAKRYVGSRYKISVAVTSGKKTPFETRDPAPSFEIIFHEKLSSTCLDLDVYLFLSVCGVCFLRHLNSKIYVRDLRKYILGRVKCTRLVKDVKHIRLLIKFHKYDILWSLSWH